MDWAPISRYFDGSVLEEVMPCDVISAENFEVLMKGEDGKVRLDHVVFNPVAKATSTQQIMDYYGFLGYTVTSIDTTYPRMAQLTDKQVIDYWKKDGNTTLAFGAAFWMYGFGKVQLSPRLETIAEEGLEYIRSKFSNAPILALHIRRGDYWNKCKRIQNPVLQAKCYPSTETVLSKIRSTSARYRRTSGVMPVVYIATNLGEFRTEIEPLRKEGFHVIYFEDVFGHYGLNLFGDENVLDSVDDALLDIEIGSKVDHFVGNFYSSFSRAIFEKRELRGLSFETF
ncbi:hypothetical protein HDU98_010593 [Podochytrium sp. JEL0797]|nr:hypothetical protein HDU98_010593 [Podochytrium sp. JEL0797]